MLNNYGLSNSPSARSKTRNAAMLSPAHSVTSRTGSQLNERHVPVNSASRANISSEDISSTACTSSV